MSDTPRTDAVSRMAVGPLRTEAIIDFARKLERELNDALRWKSEHLTVESWWVKIDTHVRKHPDCLLGRSVAEVALEFLEERDRLKAKLKLENHHPFPEGTDAADLWKMREDAYLAEIAALCQRLTLVKSAAEASIDRAHTQGVMDSLLRQEIDRLQREASALKEKEQAAYNEACDIVHELNEAGVDSSDITRGVRLLCDRITELEKDRARLDWLDATRGSVVRSNMGKPVAGHSSTPHWKTANDVRAAIDAAMEAKP